MKAAAEAKEETARTAREQSQAKTNTNALIIQTEKQLKDYGDNIPADKKSAIESALAQLKSAHEAKDVSRIDPALESLNAAWQAASQDIYQAQQDSGQDGATTDGASSSTSN